jgi:hypothetical protein
MARKNRPGPPGPTPRELAIAPGWRAVQTGDLAFVLDRDGRQVASIHGSSEERLARARLIAAAPDLLDSTMSLITTFGTMDARSPVDGPARRLSEFADPHLATLSDDQLAERAADGFKATLLAIVRAITGDEISDDAEAAFDADILAE